MAGVKTVLVSYNGSSKVFKLVAGEDELGSLKRQCRTMFKFGANVNLHMFFQKYDPDWDHFVDVDEECFFIEEKDKLQMVIQPILVDRESGSEDRNGEVSSHCIDVLMGDTADETFRQIEHQVLENEFLMMPT